MSGIMDALFGTLEVVTGSTFLPGDDPKESSTDEYGKTHEDYTREERDRRDNSSDSDKGSSWW